jgi:DNA invertase Pin-like site-specific DNA recombinase
VWGRFRKQSGKRPFRRQNPDRSGSLTKEQRKLRSAEVDEIARLYEGGMSLTAIGLRYGAHRQTVRRHLERRGLVLRDEFVNTRYLMWRAPNTVHDQPRE